MEQWESELSSTPWAAPSPDQLVAEAFDVGYRRLVVQVFLATGDLAEAEDVVREAFVRAGSAPSCFVEAPDAESWLRAAAFDRHHEWGHRLRGWAHERGGPGPGRPADALERAHRLEVVLGVVPLRRLSAHQREVLALRDLVGLSPAEVATTLRLSERSVEHLLSQARDALDQVLEVRDGARTR